MPQPSSPANTVSTPPPSHPERLTFKSPFGPTNGQHIQSDEEERGLPDDDITSHGAAEKRIQAPQTRSISFAAPSSPSDAASRPLTGPRRLSIQFAPTIAKSGDGASVKVTTDGRSTMAPIKENKTGRMPSPPPPSTYMTRVSFDTFNNPAVTDPSFTLVSKHAGYTYSRHQRVVLVAMDQNDYSEFALKWLVEEMVEDGDEIICLRVVEKEGKGANDSALSLQRNYRSDAKQMLKHIQNANEGAHNKAISVILEFAIGNVEETILQMIALYSPAFLTVGTRGRSLGGIQGLLPGSVSKWCMQNSPVPVVMVRHPEKRRKKMQKRMNNPNRRGYSAILDQSAMSHQKTEMSSREIIQASETEAEAVAKAIGLSGRLGRRKESWKEGSEAESGKSEGEEGDESEPDTPSPTGQVYVEGTGIEDMPNYVGDPDSSSEGVERMRVASEKSESAAQETEGKAVDQRNRPTGDS